MKWEVELNLDIVTYALSKKYADNLIAGGEGSDMKSYQKKNLSAPVTIGNASATTVENALAAISGVIPTSTRLQTNPLATRGDLKGIDVFGDTAGQSKQYANTWMDLAEIRTASYAHARNSVMFLLMPVYGSSTKFGLLYINLTKTSADPVVNQKTLAVSGGLIASDFGADIVWDGTTPIVTLKCKAPRNYAYYHVRCLDYTDVQPVLLNTVTAPDTEPTFISPSEVTKI
jgi:hypothetical protein